MSLWEPVRPFVTSSVCKDGGTDEGQYDDGLILQIVSFVVGSAW